MLAVLIMAFAVIPVSDMLSTVTRGTKEDKCEAEAMQFACDLMDHILNEMDFDPAKITSETWQILDRGETTIRYKVKTWNVNMDKITYPDFKYHDPPKPCEGGTENFPGMNGENAADIFPREKRLRDLDKERMPDATTDNFDLLDVKLVVDYKPLGYPDAKYGRRPIVFLSRKARL